MADHRNAEYCQNVLLKKQTLADLNLTSWSPSSSFLFKIRRNFAPKIESSNYLIKKKMLKCLQKTRAKYKSPQLTLSFTPDISQIQIGSYFSMGENTMKVPMSLFAENRRRLCEKLRASGNLPKGAVVVLQGGNSLNLYNTDVEYVFRQEPYFHWTFGAREPGFYGIIAVETGESILFVPRLPDEYATWNGALKSLNDYADIYETSQVNYVDQIKFVLRRLKESYGSLTLLTLYGLNTDSNLMTEEARFDGIEEFDLDNRLLFPVITEL